MSQKNGVNGNPLIKEGKADTINEIHDHIEWLCRVSGGDEDVHPGMLQSLYMLRGAVASLKES